MSGLVFWAVVAVYAVGWYVAAPKIARTAYAEPHMFITPVAVILGCAGALAWPLLLVGWDVWRRAKGKRSYAELQADIEALETEAFQ